MSSDNRTPRLHSFRIACAIASATLCATAIAQVAFSLKPAIEVLDNPVIADSPAYPALAISTLVPAVIGSQFCHQGTGCHRIGDALLLCLFVGCYQIAQTEGEA